MNDYEWVCVGCGMSIDGFVIETVHSLVQAHKKACKAYQEWSLEKLADHTEGET